MKKKEKSGTALRYDTNKMKMELISPIALEDLAAVLTFGSLKYEDHNWRKGMKWSRVIGSLKRHLNAIEKGEDVDPESGLLHIGHLMCNAMFLSEYYRTQQALDDRYKVVDKINKKDETNKQTRKKRK
ncbi:MAG TPA: DUF5664 domain-containing protein [Fervidobacterium sp.]|nr:DUF5664 domain-containing protein [Fervidobacterium sp.]